MGFGHCVYKNFDPRGPYIQKSWPKSCWPCFTSTIRSWISPIASLEEVSLNDRYFIDRKLYPNVDFYSGIILRAIGIPVNMSHGHVPYRPHARLDRALEGSPRRPEQPHLATPPNLHRANPAQVCAG